MIFIRFLVCLSFFVLVLSPCCSQSIEDLSNLRVDELSERQMRSLVRELDALGIPDDQVEKLALLRGMSPLEVVKFKNRVHVLRSMQKQNAVPRQAADTIAAPFSTNSFETTSSTPAPRGGLPSKNFGFDIFRNTQLSFEPNLRLPTPRSYQLAADDELVIEVSGNSEASYRLKVSPEGVIRIPAAGALSVSGLTLDEAKRIIASRLANTIYRDIRTGRTRVDANLGAIRTIRVAVTGEANLPGVFSLPSVATVYNLLYACGGPGPNGSLRKIQVFRSNNLISEIDVYQYLTSGRKQGDITLKEGDVVKINPYQIRVELSGEVKKPGFYDLLPQERLSTAIGFANGFTDEAYTARIQVYRNTDKERRLITLDAGGVQTAMPSNGDRYVIGKILNRFENRVIIEGAVYRPGSFELKQGMTLRQLIQESEGLREDAFLERIHIHRIMDDLTPSLVSVNWQQSGSRQVQDVVLRKEDRVVVYSKFDLKEGFTVSIDGEVLKPGVFSFEENMSVQDLILLGGGLKEGASTKRVEVARRIKSEKEIEPRVSTIYVGELSGNKGAAMMADTFLLQPYDEVVIRPAPGYTEQKNVFVEGEIVYRGRYGLASKTDRISDLIQRAGGLTPNAYPAGAVLIRLRKSGQADQNISPMGAMQLLKQNAQSGTPPLLLQQQINDLQRGYDYVGIDLNKILRQPGSQFDLLLNDGDTLRIPKMLETVRVNGEVLYPVLVRYHSNDRFRKYITNAGGFSERAAPKRSYIVHANGSVQGTKSFLFFKNYPSLTPGSEIYVPTRRERERLRTGEVITIGATVVTMLAVVANLLLRN